DDLSIHFFGKGSDRCTAWPSCRVIDSTRRGRTGRLIGIDASGEQGLEPRVDARQAECPPKQRIEAKRGQVPFVKHDGMPKRDRLAVVRLVCNQIKNLARPRAVSAVPIEKRCSRRHYGHGRSILLRAEMAERTAARQTCSSAAMAVRKTEVARRTVEVL